MKFLKKFPKNFLDKKILNKYNKKKLKKYSFNKKVSLSMLSYGTVGIKVLENVKLTHAQLDSFRKFFLTRTRFLSRVWFKGSFVTPLTKKSDNTRMGKGKGKLSHWVSEYKKGSLILEFENFSNFNNLHFLKLLRTLKFKFPFNYCIIFKNSKLHV